MTGRPPGHIPIAWQCLIDAYGGRAALVERIGTTEATLSRWIAGLIAPGGPARKKIRELAAAEKMRSPV